jgi:dTDP-4-dehydrorhamnose 3,5-epimerase
MHVKVMPTTIPGCMELLPVVRQDRRGKFVKTFHQDSFRRMGLETDFKESYYSVSCKRTLRGLHFQMPPMDHVKMVYCVHGEVLDVVVDLRKGSPSFGTYELFELNDEKANIIYIPKGVAHGFYVLSQQAIMVYHVSTVYSPQHDSGILWNSLDIPWPDQNPIVSERDQRLIPFSKFISPFVFEEKL